MRVDFYQLSRDPAEGVVPLLARNALKAGERLLVVSADEAQLGRIGEGLWTLRDSFLANGRAGGEHDARQPVLLSDRMEPANGARFLAIADGQWREPDPGFARVFYIFDERTVEQARGVWRALGQQGGMERHFWRQDGGRWIEAG